LAIEPAVLLAGLPKIRDVTRVIGRVFSSRRAGVIVFVETETPPGGHQKGVAMIATDIQNAYNRTKWALILRGLLSLAVGVAIVARPMDSAATLALVIAIWALFDGIVGIVRSFDLRGVVQHWWVMLLAGIVGVAFGIAALYYFPGLSLTFAVVWTAYWLTVSGVMASYIAWQERALGLSWGWTMAFGVLAIVGGVIAFMNPTATLATLLGVISGFAFVGGVLLLVGAGRMVAVQQNVKSSFSNAARA
jgi:uncharacterized membrane protein HdeD (DUF308 family)